ncbi:MAG: hypothetical protein IT454_13945 [Planctomycetes bacterium]|nr:hypothetical protein [Planctomycetota bacterium]
MNTQRSPEHLVEPLRRTLAWLMSLRDAQGRIWCPEHGLEHTGKSAGAAVLAARLARHDAPERRAAHVGAAIEQGRRLVANLRREGTSECHTFWPGRHDPFNSSNAVIDGGACSDALAELALELGSELSADDARAFRDASVLHARTYLRYAALDKGIPAQRAWGLSGLAAAWRVCGDEVLENAALQAVGALEGIQHPDGSFPYHPLEWGAEHAGASDVSSFYHSRIPGFTIFALEQLGRDPSRAPFAQGIGKAVDFLEALQAPDGTKCGLVEAKPWYWGAEYEVASHVFDVYTFARAWKHFGEPRFGRAALRAFRAWCEHLSAAGVPRSHLPGPERKKSYQCPVFWACHAEWIARVLPDLAELEQRFPDTQTNAVDGIDLSVRWYPDAQLARLEDGAVLAWVRGARPAYNVHHGSPHGAGLIRAVSKRDRRELVRRQRLAADQEGEWSARAGTFALGRGLEHGAQAMRFSLWLMRNHARGRRFSAALGAPFDVLRRGVLEFASSAVSSSFDASPLVEVDATGVSLRSRLCWRGGLAVPHSALERRFELDGRGLLVHENVIAPGAVRALHYGWPERASERVNGDGLTYRLA